MSGNDDMSDELTIGGGFGSGSWRSDSLDSDSSESSFTPEDSTGGNVVNYYFPVEVVYCGAGEITPNDRETIQAGIFQDLYDAINRRLV